MQQRIGLLAVVTAMVVLASPVKAGGIRVLSANYGDAQSGQICNAAPAVATMCGGRKLCSFDVRNIALCGDPSFLVVKNLNVTYTCGVGYYKTQVSEYAQSTLSCK